ncbi:MAG: hypothetical protein GTO16_11565 [Candidatus Aminicenantes bacterium]|nr:hypothetical protein [Candidatus Aminicenantes bacterium]
MGKFSKLYIKGCILAQEKIRYFRVDEQYKETEGEIITPKPIFKEGDYFHHPDLMEEEEVKVVKEVIGNDLYASDSTKPYPKDESVWIPTADQIRAGLEVVCWPLGDVSSLNEEELLDKFKESLEKNEE